MKTLSNLTWPHDMNPPTSVRRKHRITSVGYWPAPGTANGGAKDGKLRSGVESFKLKAADFNSTARARLVTVRFTFTRKGSNERISRYARETHGLTHEKTTHKCGP